MPKTSKNHSWRLTNAQKRLYRRNPMFYSNPSIGLIIRVKPVRNNIIISYISWNPWRNR